MGSTSPSQSQDGLNTHSNIHCFHIPVKLSHPSYTLPASPHHSIPLPDPPSVTVLRPVSCHTLCAVESPSLSLALCLSSLLMSVARTRASCVPMAAFITMASILPVSVPRSSIRRPFHAIPVSEPLLLSLSLKRFLPQHRKYPGEVKNVLDAITE